MAEAAMTVRAVVACLDVDEKTVFYLSQKREPPGCKVGGAWTIKPEDIDRWIATQTAYVLKETDAGGSSSNEISPKPRRPGRKKL